MNPNMPPITDTQWSLSGQFDGDDTMREFFVEESPFTVGRRPEMSLTIPCPTVSSRHAELIIENNQLFVCDCNSTNGTFVNGNRVSSRCALNHGDLLQFAQSVFRITCGTVSSSFGATIENDSSDQALALIQFDKLLTERAVVPHFQPIVSLHDRETIGYEILGRSKLFGLSDPKTMFSAAAVLNLESELSRIFRSEGVSIGVDLPANHSFFVNTHPTEMEDMELLLFSLRELRELTPERPIVLEIHEASAARTKDMRELRAALNDLQMGLAYDDFGAGQARLVELVEVPSEYLKFDMQLVQGLGEASVDRRKMVESLVHMTRDLGIEPLAEGIELEIDHQACVDIGFTSAQGFLYCKPSPVQKLLNVTETSRV